MWLLNRSVGLFVDGLLYPFRQLPPFVGLSVVSLLTATAMLLVFRATSDQKRLAAVKRQIRAGLFEIRLFNDDIGAIFRAQAQILRHNLTYLRLTAIPTLWILGPLALLIAQLQFHYGYRGLNPGESALIKVELGDESAPPSDRGATIGDEATDPAVVLEVPSGIRVETPAVWIPSLREAAWRIAAERRGDYELTIRLGDRSFTKSVIVSPDVVRRSPLRPSRRIDQFLYPAEPPLPGGGGVRSIALTYPESGVSIVGWDVHWMIVFFALSMVFAFALKGRFGVVL